MKLLSPGRLLAAFFVTASLSGITASFAGAPLSLTMQCLPYQSIQAPYATYLANAVGIVTSVKPNDVTSMGQAGCSLSLSIPDCPDTGGRHLNYSSGIFVCGASGGTGTSDLALNSGGHLQLNGGGYLQLNQ